MSETTGRPEKSESSKPEDSRTGVGLVNGRLEYLDGNWKGWPVHEKDMTASEICDYWG